MDNYRTFFDDLDGHYSNTRKLLDERSDAGNYDE